MSYSVYSKHLITQYAFYYILFLGCTSWPLTNESQYAQTMISELMPEGYDNMFFALFGITNRAVCTYDHVPKVPRPTTNST